MSEVKEEKSHVVFSLQNKAESIVMPACLSNNSSKFGSCCGADTCSTGKVGGLIWYKFREMLYGSTVYQTK